MLSTQVAVVSPTLGAMTAAPGAAFVLVRVTVPGSQLERRLETSAFTLISHDSEGTEREAAAVAHDDDNDTCAGAVVPAGESMTCNVAFLVDASEQPRRLLLHEDSVDLDLVVPPAQCLLADDFDAECLELCLLDACLMEGGRSSLAPCAEGCVAVCTDIEDPCLCASAGCAPECSALPEAFDACSAPCFLLCAD